MRVVDVEVYPNYALVMYRDPNTDSVKYMETKGTLDLSCRKELHSWFRDPYENVTYNGARYDMHILRALANGDSAEQVHRLSSAIINGIYVASALPCIDMMGIHLGMRTSLKRLALNLHCKIVSDLPFDPQQPLDTAQIDSVREYCKSDVDNTTTLFRHYYDLYESRKAAQEQQLYGLSTWLYSHATSLVEQLARDTHTNGEHGHPLYSAAIPGLRPETERLYQRACEAPIEDYLHLLNSKGKPEVYGRFTLGKGGIHSVDTPGVYKDVYLYDVSSFYSALAIRLGAYGHPFGDLYKQIYQNKVYGTPDKPTRDAQKLILNSSYGKLGSAYSVLYNPRMLQSITTAGQFYMLSLIEAVGVDNVISANTDGIVTSTRLVDDVSKWAKNTGFRMTERRLPTLIVRDVNNYWCDDHGKGIFARGIGHGPNGDIVADSVVQHIRAGTPIEARIYACNDIRAFLYSQIAREGCYWNNQYQGKAVRWFRANQSPDLVRENGSRLSNGYSVRPCATLPNSLPVDLDRGFYVKAANKLLKTITGKESE